MCEDGLKTRSVKLLYDALATGGGQHEFLVDPSREMRWDAFLDSFSAEGLVEVWLCEREADPVIASIAHRAGKRAIIISRDSDLVVSGLAVWIDINHAAIMDAVAVIRAGTAAGVCVCARARVPLQ